MSNTVIQIKKSTVSGNIPTSLAQGELAINTADGILFYKDPNNTIKSISTGSTTNSFSTINVSSTLIIATNKTSILSFGANNGIIISGDFVSDTITISGEDATITDKGVVQLYDETDSTSSVLAATANAVNKAYLLANTAFNNSVTGSTTTNLTYQEFTSSNNQTEFFVTNGYNVGKVRVFVNGVLLNSSDYTASNGVSIVLAIPAILNDIVTVEKWYNDVATSNTYNLSFGSLDSNTVITSANTANQVLDLFSTDLYRSIKYQIQVTSATDYQVSELLLIHNGIDSFLTEYGLLTTSNVLMEYNSDVNSGNVRLLMSPVNTVNAVKLVKTSIVV